MHTHTHTCDITGQALIKHFLNCTVDGASSVLT